MASYLPLQWANSGFALRRLGQDCAPNQELRELVQNALDAHRRCHTADPTHTGQVVVDADWDLHALEGGWKLAVVDDADGMTGAEMERQVRTMFSSGNRQGLGENFGIGAKIAAGVRSPEGVVWLSWRDGSGAMVRFRHFADDDVYGLEQFALGDGSYAHWLPVSDDLRPDLVAAQGEAAHGTKVVLLGDRPGANTIAAPAGWPGGRSRWLVQYLNRRYLRFPDYATVRARVWAQADPKHWPDRPVAATRDGAALAEVTGMGPLLNRFASASGRSELADATVHWWLLPDEAAPGWQTMRSRALDRGHVAAVFDEELYELRTASAGSRMLQRFGIVVGHERVVLYVEPNQDLGAVPNTARSQLLIDGRPLPWGRWAAAFGAALPEPLARLQSELLSHDDDRAADAIARRLRRILALLTAPPLRRRVDGTQRVDPEDRAGGGIPAELGASTTGDETAGGTGGRDGDAYAAFALPPDHDGDPADPIRRLPDRIPTIVWVSLSDGTRTSGDLEERAGRYLAESDTLMLNDDWIGFQALRASVTEACGGVDGAGAIVGAYVREWCAQQVVEAVLRVRSLRGSRHWSDDDLARALSEESLTAAAAPCWHVRAEIMRAVTALRRTAAAS
jgi:hypothetical protein